MQVSESLRTHLNLICGVRINDEQKCFNNATGWPGNSVTRGNGLIFPIPEDDTAAKHYIARDPGRIYKSKRELAEELVAVAKPASENVCELEKNIRVAMKRMEIERATFGEITLGDNYELEQWGENLDGYGECGIIARASDTNIKEYLTMKPSRVRERKNGRRRGKGNKKAVEVPKTSFEERLRSNKNTFVIGINEPESSQILPFGNDGGSIKDTYNYISPLKTGSERKQSLKSKPTVAGSFFRQIQAAIDNGNKDFVVGAVHPLQQRTDQKEPHEDPKMTAPIPEALPILPEINCRPASPPLEAELNQDNGDDDNSLANFKNMETSLPTIPEVMCKSVSPPALDVFIDETASDSSTLKDW